jgi:hypothetical protein
VFSRGGYYGVACDIASNDVGVSVGKGQFDAFEGVTYTRAQYTQNTDHGETIRKITAYRYVPYFYIIDINFTQTSNDLAPHVSVKAMHLDFHETTNEPSIGHKTSEILKAYDYYTAPIRTVLIRIAPTSSLRTKSVYAFVIRWSTDWSWDWMKDVVPAVFLLCDIDGCPL